MVSARLHFLHIILVLSPASGFGFTISDVIETFSSCLVVQLNLNPTLSYPPTQIPSILANGTRHLSRPHMRKSFFCVSYFVLFPEFQVLTNTSKVSSMYWINQYLLKVGVIFKTVQAVNVNNRPYLLEPHYILIVSSKPYTTWTESFAYSADRVRFCSSLYLFHTVETLQGLTNHDHPQIIKAYYFCKHCAMFHFILFRIPFPPQNKSVSKSYLDQQETYLYQDGRQVHVQFGIIKFYQSTKSIYKRHMINFKKNPAKLSPFAPKSRLNMIKITEILLFQGLDHKNSSELYSNYSYRFFSLRRPQGFRIFVPRLRPIINYQDPHLDKSSFQLSFTLVNRLSFNFITCDGIKLFKNTPAMDRIVNSISFQVWLVILFGMIIPPILFTLLSRVNELSSRTQFGSILFNLQLFIAILFENGSDLNIQRHLKSYKHFFPTIVYFNLAGWLLALIILNNVYKGILTSDEVAPPEPQLKWKHIHELVNFTIATPFKIDSTTSIVKSPVANTLLWYTLSYLNYLVDKYKNHFHFKYPHMLCFTDGKSKCSRNSNNLTYKLRGFPLENSHGFYNIVSNCNASAFVDLNSRIDSFLEFFNYEMKKGGGNKIFMKGSDDFLSPNQGWMMVGYNELHLGRLYRRLQSLIHSGILMLFENWRDKSIFKTKVTRKRSENTMHPLSLKDIPGAGLKIQKVAYCVAVTVFCLEVMLHFIISIPLELTDVLQF